MAESVSSRGFSGIRRVAPTNAFIPFPKEAVERSIPDRFELQVLRGPDRLAVKAGDLQFRYQDLNQAANRVAHAILARSGAGEGRIALLLEHGATLIAAILGVLKAGKTCVPLDPSYPGARNSFMLEDCEASLVVMGTQTESVATELTRGRRELMNIEIGSGFSGEDPGLPIRPGSPAWILYTSGSTGRPKGTVHSHRSVLHNILRYTNGLHICSEDRLTVLHSFCFVASTSNTFGALLNGASLFPYDIKKEGIVGLADWLAREELTIYHSVPTVFRHLVETFSGKQGGFPKLRLIKPGGEPVLRREVALYRKHFSANCLLHVGLGATEMSNFRQFFLDKDTDFSGAVVPVGYAVPDVEVFILDSAGNAVAANVIGEIAVRSRYLSPGYWRRPDLTREAFRTGPDGEGGRTYLTGDLGYLLPDGCLVHCGRRDFLIKIRGHRVEAAEVEMAMLEIEGVRGAAVSARPDGDGGRRLVAYIVAGPEPAPTLQELQLVLRAKLPEALVPSAVVLLDSLPLTPNGKVDRRALPDPNEPRRDRDASFAAPRNPVEALVASVWSDMLGLARVGIHEDFFALGGHSLIAIRILLRLHQLLELHLPLRVLLERPTVADLAEAVARSRGSGARAGVARLLAELNALSEQDAERLLAEGRSGGNGGRLSPEPGAGL